MIRKMNIFVPTAIFIVAVAVYFIPLIDAIMITFLLMNFFIGGIFAFGSYTAKAKKKYNPLFRIGVSSIGFFSLSYAVFSYAEFYQGFVYPFGFIPFMISVFAACLLTALGITFYFYEPENQK